MIESRRWPSCTRVSPTVASRTPTASGPRWAIRSTMVRTTVSPSGWQNAPATPHTSGVPVRGALVGAGGVRQDDHTRNDGPADETVVHVDVGRPLVRPAE